MRYRVVLASFDDFMTPIREHLHALSYSPPAPGHGVADPSLAFIFDAPAAAEQVFDIFGKWAGAPAAGAAIGLSLVTRDDGAYTMCVYPEMSHLQARLAPGPLAAHLDARVVSPAHMKTFPGPSQNLPEFKAAALGKLVTILPGLTNGSLAPGLAIADVPIRFLQEAELSPSDYEYALLNGVEPSDSPSEPDDRRPEVLARRRRTLLSRYFPVTLERLRFDPAFERASRQLAREGYASWQVQQAACNLTLSDRLLDLPEDDRDAVGILMGLEASPEELPQPPLQWTLDSLRVQLASDIQELTNWLSPELADASVTEHQGWLRQRGDLEEQT